MIPTYNLIAIGDAGPTSDQWGGLLWSVEIGPIEVPQVELYVKSKAKVTPDSKIVWLQWTYRHGLRVVWGRDRRGDLGPRITDNWCGQKAPMIVACESVIEEQLRVDLLHNHFTSLKGEEGWK